MIWLLSNGSELSDSEGESKQRLSTITRANVELGFQQLIFKDKMPGNDLIALVADHLKVFRERIDFLHNHRIGSPSVEATLSV
jgi:hypothetical protein